jgi:hypothetical protein
MLGVGITGNFTSVLKSIEQRRERVSKVPSKTLDQAAHMGESMAKKLVRVKTGALRGSIDITKIGDNERWIGPKKWYGIIIEKGSKPHLIIPKSFDGYLYWKGAKHPVRSVKHPGTKPYPFMEPTYQYLKVYYPRLMQENMHKALS